MHEQSENITASDKLRAWILGQVGRGPVTFAQFMEWALYHPDWGYYTRGPNIGTRGDFTTSSEASPAFGMLMARHVADIDEMLGKPRHFTVLEFGPGRGTLARDLLENLCAEQPEIYARLQYLMVDVSPGLRHAQAELLASHSSKTRWLDPEASIGESFEGAILANEVVDAFPVHVLENREGAIREWYVRAPEGDLEIVLGEPSRPELLEFLTRENIQLLPGERVEINTAAEKWVAGLSDLLRRGVATIIDYGDTAPQRYSEARREGTVLGYFGGSVTDDLLGRPGAQDLTALVDFTALRRAAAAAGFDELGMTRQANFLLGLGLGTSVTATSRGDDLASALAFRRGLQALINPEGLGRFHVLILGKGLGPGKSRAALRGLLYADV